MTKTTIHETAVEAHDQFTENLDNACGQGKWLAAVFAVGPDGQLQMHRTTFNFPIERIDEAVGLLRDSLEQEKGGARPTPLPLADFLQRHGNGDGQLKVHQDQDPLTQGEPDKV